MKFKLILSLIILFIFAPIYGQNREVKRVAILKTIDKEGQIPYAVKLMIRSKLCAAITNTPGYEGYDRVDVASIMDEQEFQRTGLVDDSQIKKLGEMAGADYILIAEAASLGGSDIIITAKILEVESGRMENASDVYTSLSPAELDKNCRILSGKLLNLNIETGTINNDVIANNNRHIRRPTTTIYYRSTSIICNGVYHSISGDYNHGNHELYYDLGDNLNRNFFEISFEYYISPSDIGNDMNLITLSEWYREFGLKITNSKIIVTTDNQNYLFDTEISVFSGWNKINLVYNNGNLYINNQFIQIGPLDNDGDNVLSSINFSNGTCFKGTLRNILVKSDF